MDISNSVLVLVAAFGGLIILFVFLYFVPVNLWITAIFSNVKVGLLELVGMRIRKVPPGVIVNSLIDFSRQGKYLSFF